MSGTTDAGPDGTSLHPGDAGGQARAAFAIVEGALREAGFTLEDVVRTRMYVVDPADIPAVDRRPRRAVRGGPAGGDARRRRAADDARACWSRSRRRPAEADAGLSADARVAEHGDEADADEQPEEQVPAPRDDEQARDHAQDLDADHDLVAGLARPLTSVCEAAIDASTAGPTSRR